MHSTSIFDFTIWSCSWHPQHNQQQQVTLTLLRKHICHFFYNIVTILATLREIIGACAPKETPLVNKRESTSEFDNLISCLYIYIKSCSVWSNLTYSQAHCRDLAFILTGIRINLAHKTKSGRVLPFVHCHLDGLLGAINSESTNVKLKNAERKRNI